MECVDYKYKLWHLLLVNPDIFRKLCVSYDKTEMFLIGLSRLAIYGFIFYLVFRSNKRKSKIIMSSLCLIVGFAVIINLAALIVILMKTQLISSAYTKEFLRKKEEKSTEELISSIRIREDSSRVPDFFFETVI